MGLFGIWFPQTYNILASRATIRISEMENCPEMGIHVVLNMLEGVKTLES